VRLIAYFLAAAMLITGCATRRADHFYTLSAQSWQAGLAHAAFTRQVSLHVTLPSLMARDQVTILEHERWASPLLDQLTSTLGQDLEARRADLVVANRSIEQGKLPASKISVEIVRWAAQLGGQVSIETRWRVMDSVSGNVSVGRDIFSAPTAPDGYAQVAAALSACVAQLADKLVAQLPAT
jgi:uncharacterized protein